MDSWSMDSADLNHGHAVGADDLSLAGLRAVNRGIDGHVMGDVSGRAVGCGNHVSHAVALARGARGGLVDSVKKHCKAFLPLWLV